MVWIFGSLAQSDWRGLFGICSEGLEESVSWINLAFASRLFWESVTRGFVQLYARGFGNMVELKRGLWNCVEI